jgi:hypothetical protein
MITLSVGITESILSVSAPDKFILYPCPFGKRLKGPTEQYVEALNKETNITFQNNS